MNRKDNHKLFSELRELYPLFVYENYRIVHDKHKLHIEFSFNLSNSFFFKPTLVLPLRPFYDASVIDNPLFRTIVFHIGLIEMISYWKATCSPRIVVLPALLDPHQVSWLKKLIYYGLGEFFYTNSIITDQDSLVDISSASNMMEKSGPYAPTDGYIIPAGGGKDSCVTLNLLSGLPSRAFILNPRKTIIDTLSVAHFPVEESIVFYRDIHPQLLELNKKGFLNGHTPFSALLAFHTLLAGLLSKYGHIALSNESSANDATIPHTHINHQYSKTFEFERDFRDYCATYISRDFNYFSLLRPFNELQIAQLFSRAPGYFPVFRSCNVGSTSDAWCGRCAKCLFTYIILSPFLPESELIPIFGYNLLDNFQLKDIFDQLTGRSDKKPFECVGTVQEVNAALELLLRKSPSDSLPSLLRYHLSADSGVYIHISPENLLRMFNPSNFVPSELTQILKSALYGQCTD